MGAVSHLLTALYAVACSAVTLARGEPWKAVVPAIVAAVMAVAFHRRQPVPRWLDGMACGVLFGAFTAGAALWARSGLSEAAQGGLLGRDPLGHRLFSHRGRVTPDR